MRDDTDAVNGSGKIQNRPQPGARPYESQGKHEEEENPNNPVTQAGEPQVDRSKEQLFRESLLALNASGVNYAVGATFARNFYTGIWRNTKDLDIFVKPGDLRTALDAHKQAGFKTKIEQEHWLAKARKGKDFVDFIFGIGNGHFPIDDSFFEGCQNGEVLGVPTRLAPLEEIFATDAYIATRGRFDGSEILHLMRAVKGKLDWQRILRRLGDNRQLLLWHLVLFDFVYPGHSNYLPQEIMIELFEEMRQSWNAPVKDVKAFRGTLIDPFLFRVDIDEWGYEDRRLMQPLVNEKGEPV